MGEFEPRRAEPGTVFGYTGTDTREIDDGEDVPDGWAVTHFDPETNRRTLTQGGVQKTIRTNDEGVVQPRDEVEVAVLDGFDLPVARKAIAEQKKSEAPDSKKE